MTPLQEAALEVLKAYKFEDGAPAMLILKRALAEEMGTCINKLLETQTPDYHVNPNSKIFDQMIDNLNLYGTKGCQYCEGAPDECRYCG